MAYEIVYRASAYTGRPRGIGDWDALPATDSFDGIPAAVDAITQLQAMGGEWAAELGVREIGELYPAEIIATRDNLSIGLWEQGDNLLHDSWHELASGDYTDAELDAAISRIARSRGLSADDIYVRFVDADGNPGSDYYNG